MKLATLKDGTRDGTLLVVSRDLAHALKADPIAPTLQAALDAPERVAGVVLIDGSRIGMGDPETAGRVMREQIRATGYGAFARRLFEEMFLPSSGVMLKTAIVERAPYVDVVFGPQTLHRLPELLARRRSSGAPTACSGS